MLRSIVLTTQPDDRLMVPPEMHSPPTILIVDDDEGHALLIRENLAEAGMQNPITRFRDGQAFLDYFFDRNDHAAPHLRGAFVVLLDIRMPKVDGIEVLRRIKNDPEFRKLPVVMLTTTDDAREVERCYSLGCSAYIKKPVDFELFADAMRRLSQFMRLLLVPQIAGR